MSRTEQHRLQRSVKQSRAAQSRAEQRARQTRARQRRGERNKAAKRAREKKNAMTCAKACYRIVRNYAAVCYAWSENILSMRIAENSRGPEGGASTENTNPTPTALPTRGGTRSRTWRPPSPVTVIATAPTPPTAAALYFIKEEVKFYKRLATHTLHVVLARLRIWLLIHCS
jgi:hypothetical protein